MNPRPRPTTAAPAGLQHERTALAWERTAFSLMGVALVLARFSTIHDQGLLVGAALVLLALAAGLLVWSGVLYQDRHTLLRLGHDVTHPSATRLVGLLGMAGTGLSLLAAALAAAR